MAEALAEFFQHLRGQGSGPAHEETHETANLARREADLAVRHHPPQSGNLYVAKLGTFGCAVYRRHGSKGDAWVTYTEDQAHYEPARWVQRQVKEANGAVALRASSMLMHVEAILAGTGRGVLPCYVGDGHPLLERLTPPIGEIAASYWMIVHRDLRRAPCVRAVIDWIRQAFADQRDMIAGVAMDRPDERHAPIRKAAGRLAARQSSGSQRQVR